MAKIETNLQLKKINIFFYHILQFTLDLKKGRPRKLWEKPSALRREHPALQNMKFLNFFVF